MQSNKFKAFSLLELMIVMTIVVLLGMGAQIAYTDYTKRTAIASLTQLAGSVKIDVENAHNQGVIFGTTGSQEYVSESDTDKPYGLESLIRVSYGCIDMKVDTAALKLSGSDELTMTLCPTTATDSNYIEWRCGYQATSAAAFIKYLPSSCQNTVASIRDVAF